MSSLPRSGKRTFRRRTVWAVSEGLLLGDDVTGEPKPLDGSAHAELVTMPMRCMG